MQCQEMFGVMDIPQAVCDVLHLCMQLKILIYN